MQTSCLRSSSHARSKSLFVRLSHGVSADNKKRPPVGGHFHFEVAKGGGLFRGRRSRRVNQSRLLWTAFIEEMVIDAVGQRSRRTHHPRVSARGPGPPTPQLLTSLRRFVVSLRLIFSASLPGSQPQRPSARKYPLIPRGHLAMCPQPAASLIIHTSSTRFRPDAYGGSCGRGVRTAPHLSGCCFAVSVGSCSSLRAFHPEPLIIGTGGSVRPP
jgi:hypothetical protein